MFKVCESCGHELAWRDNDDPLLNCVERCENSKCKSPHCVFYYEAPADVSLFRATELWEECLYETAGVTVSETDNLLKQADALYLKRVNA